MTNSPCHKRSILPPSASIDEDICVFAEHCVFMRSVYLHGKKLFEHSTPEDKDRMGRAAPTLFGDLNRVFIEYMILQVCRITDPAEDFRKNDNHTIAFLLKRYDFQAEPTTKARRLSLTGSTASATRWSALATN
jgi:hypothetical protein